MRKRNNIQAFRLCQGMTQEELAKKLGIPRSTVAAWEAGIAYPQASRLIELAKALRVSIEELLGEKKE